MILATMPLKPDDVNSTSLVVGLLLFVAAGAAIVLGALLLGKLLRPKAPNPDKSAPYECGELPVGTSWIQFDLRFYVVALVFVIFDVEVALFYAWAVVYGGGMHEDQPLEALRQMRWGAMIDMLFFFGVVVVGFLYLWKYGYLDWVRTSGSRGAKRRSDAGSSE
jgi:NADH-quinone oxidoreductase subunit A